MWLQKVVSKCITSGFIHSRFESASVKEIQWREEKKELFGERGRRRRIMGKEGKEIEGGKGIRSHLSRVADPDAIQQSKKLSSLS